MKSIESVAPILTCAGYMAKIAAIENHAGVLAISAYRDVLAYL
jgi:hypothetical protein